MKAGLIGKSSTISRKREMVRGKSRIYNEGSSTIELIISFSVLILTMTAVLLIAFGNQSNTLYADLNQEALYKANRVLEDARADTKENYLSVVTESYSPESIYSLAREVVDLTPCKKRATARVTWQVDVGRPQKVELTNEFVDIPSAIALGGTCATTPPSSPWENPDTADDIDFSPSGNDGTDVGVALMDGVKYAFVTSKASSPGKDDFWVIRTDPALQIVGQIHTGPGLNAVAVDPPSRYAYAANDNNMDQLQVIDVSIPASPGLEVSMTLPNIIFTCSPVTDPCLAGRSIAYYDGKIYIGTDYIANLALPPTKNNEFHIYCVSDTSIPGCGPSTPVWLGSYNVNHSVHEIIVRNQLVAGVSKTVAYLATTANSGEVMVLDVTDPASISEIGSGFNAPGDEDGESIFLIGNTLYLGRDRTPASRKDFYILDVTDPAAITERGSKHLDLNPSTAAVVGIAVSGDLAFLATTGSTKGFQVWNIKDPTNIIGPSLCNILNYPEQATGIDYLDDRVYTTNNANKALRVIWDNTALSC